MALRAFKGIKSSTRVVSITLKGGATVDSLPHQLRIFEASALVVAPGKTPMCLRCKVTGHIWKECRVPRCQERNHYGHEAEGCVKTYAVVTEVAQREEVIDLVMDIAEAMAAAAGAPGDAADVGEKGAPKELYLEQSSVILPTEEGEKPRKALEKTAVDGITFEPFKQVTRLQTRLPSKKNFRNVPRTPGS